MSFTINLARREVRSGWKRLIFFFVCIGVGVGSIVTLRSVIQSLNHAVTGEARNLLGADVQVDTGRPWTDQELSAINFVAKAPLVQERTETIESSTMLRPSDESNSGSLMIELKAVDDNFPLLGAFTLADGSSVNAAALSNNGAVVAQQLLDRLNLKVGDRVRIGTEDFQIRAVIGKEPGGTGGFRLGPRVFVDRAGIDHAGLTGFGSRARRKILFRTKDGEVDELVKQLRSALKDTIVNIRSYKDSEQNLSEQFQRAENYLSLTGLVILVLGGIGVANVTRVFVEQKKKSIAVLKCLGATGTRITKAYLLQMLALGVAGSLVGVALAKLSLVLVKSRFSASLPANMTYGLSYSAVTQGLVLGLVITFLFSSLPLLAIRDIKPNLLLRDEADPRRRFDVLRFAAAAICIAILLAVVSWQAGSLLVGASFLAGMAVTAGALYLAASILMWAIRRTQRFHSFAMRQAINGMYRPGNQSRVIIMAVGLGAFLVLSVLLLQANLLNEFSFLQRRTLPEMFVIDIQTDQATGVEQIVEQYTGSKPQLVPTVRMRIYAVNDRKVDFDDPEMRRSRDLLGREYVATYRSNLESNESIVAGKYWDPTPSADPEISIEEGLRGVAGLDVGGTLTFDVLGRKIRARVTSVRKVDWRNSRTGFLVLFRPGVLESAPQMLISPITASLNSTDRSHLQRALIDRFPNLSVIDVSEIIQSVQTILSNITLAVTFVGGLVLFAGTLILVGSVAMSKFQRVYETAILKTLGAKRKVLISILLAEYSLLGLIAALIGAAGATALSWCITRYVFKIDWAWTPSLLISGTAATIALVVIVGAVASLDVITRKPLPILRTA